MNKNQSIKIINRLSIFDFKSLKMENFFNNIVIFQLLNPKNGISNGKLLFIKKKQEIHRLQELATLETTVMYSNQFPFPL